jgi:hypothetical protein
MSAHSAQKLIRHQETFLFLKNELEWTSHPDEARHFESIWAAADYAMKHGLENVESVLQFEAHAPVTCDVYYSLRSAPGSLTEGSRLAYQPVCWPPADEKK